MTVQQLDDSPAMLLDGARYGDLEDVAAALQAGAPVDSADANGRTALHMASANGHTEIVASLLSRGAVR